MCCPLPPLASPPLQLPHKLNQRELNTKPTGLYHSHGAYGNGLCSCSCVCMRVRVRVCVVYAVLWGSFTSNHFTAMCGTHLLLLPYHSEEREQHTHMHTRAHTNTLRHRHELYYWVHHTNDCTLCWGQKHHADVTLIRHTSSCYRKNTVWCLTHSVKLKLWTSQQKWLLKWEGRIDRERRGEMPAVVCQIPMHHQNKI